MTPFRHGTRQLTGRTDRVLRRDPRKGYRERVELLCDCGHVHWVDGTSWRRGVAGDTCKRCALRRLWATRRATKHGPDGRWLAGRAA